MLKHKKNYIQSQPYGTHLFNILWSKMGGICKDSAHCRGGQLSQGKALARPWSCELNLLAFSMEQLTD